MSAQIIALKDWRGHGNHEGKDQLLTTTRLEDSRREMLATLESMMRNCGLMLAHCQSDIISEAHATIGNIHYAIKILPVASPSAPQVYKEVADLIERLGDVLQDEIRAQVGALSG